MLSIDKILSEIDCQSLSSITEIESGNSFNEGQFKEAIKKRAIEFSRQGLVPGQCVIVNHANSIKFFVDFLALFFLNITAIPVDPSTNERELEKLIGFAMPALIITEATDLKGPGKINPELNGVALVLFTSGTTSLPKGVMIKKSSLMLKFEVILRQMGKDVVENVLCFVSTFFGHGLICNSLFPLFNGQQFFIAKKLTMETIGNFSDILTKKRITFFSSVPSHWQMILEFSQPPSRHFLKRVNCASAPLNDDLVKRIQAWLGNVPFYDVYGATEMLGWFADRQIDQGLTKVPFKNFWEVELKVNSENELLVKSEYMFWKYWSDENTMRDDFFNTGDVFVENRIAGRTKNTINKAGIKVHAEDIVFDFMQSGLLKAAAAFPIEDEIAGQKIGLFIVPKHSIELKDVNDYCRDAISPVKHPDEIIIVEEIPHNSRGKTSQDQLIRYYLKSNDIHAKALKVFNNVFKTDYESINIKKTDVINWDSLRYAELIITLQKEFSIRFNAGDISRIDNFPDLILQVKKSLATQPNKP